MSLIKWIFCVIPMLGILCYVIFYLPLGDSIQRFKTNEKIVVLTFDDGPSENYTEKILEVLSKYNIHATFFLLGKEIIKYPNIIRKIAEEKHEIGHHSYSHSYMIFKTPSKIEKEIIMTNKLFSEIGINTTKFFRPPYGAQFISVPIAMKHLGMTSVHFDVEARDWKLNDANLIFERVIKLVNPGSIIVFHDGGGNRNNTIIALEKTIIALKENGYSFKTLTQMQK